MSIGAMKAYMDLKAWLNSFRNSGHEQATCVEQRILLLDYNAVNIN